MLEHAVERGKRGDELPLMSQHQCPSEGGQVQVDGFRLQPFFELPGFVFIDIKSADLIEAHQCSTEHRAGVDATRPVERARPHQAMAQSGSSFRHQRKLRSAS